MGKKTISRILYSPITYRYEDQDVLNNKNHALGHHSKVGLAGLVYPDQTKPIPLRATSFFFSFTPSFISLHLSASLSRCYGFFFFLPPTKKCETPFIYFQMEHEKEGFFCCRKIHCRLRKEGLKRWDEGCERFKVRDLVKGRECDEKLDVKCAREKKKQRAEHCERHIFIVTCYSPALWRVFLCPFFCLPLELFVPSSLCPFSPMFPLWGGLCCLQPSYLFFSLSGTNSTFFVVSVAFGFKSHYNPLGDDMMLSGRRGEKGNRF